MSISRILLLFFLSGSTSLVYEVVWMRRLSLVFGHSIFSVSTVLTTFMSGLALGSYFAGRWSDRKRQTGHGPVELLKAYGKLELFIGLWGLLSLWLLNGVEAGFLALSRSGYQGSSLTVFLFLSSFCVLLPPTIAMGATLPIFTQVLVMRRNDTGQLLSRIYGLNTLGACLGAAIGGLVGLPNLGLNLTVAVTAVLNIFVTVLAYSLARDLPDTTPKTTEETSDEHASPLSPSLSRLVPLVFGLSGFAGMVYQLGWTRALVLSIGSSTYSFSIILTSFLASLGAGSYLYRRLFSRRQPSVRALALLQFFIALSALLVTVGMGYLPQLKLASFSWIGTSFPKVVAFDTAMVLLLLLPPTLALGLTFPLVTHLYSARLEELGRRLGEAYAANTAGAILGSFSGGFILLPWLGLENTIRVAATLNLLGGLLLLYSYSSQRAVRRRPEIAFVLATLGVMFFAPSWDLALMSSGLGIGYQGHVRRPNVIFYQDGVSSTVSVGLNSGIHPYIAVNGKTDASLTPSDRSTQLLLGLLPGVLHPNPSQVAVIGFGSGQTPVGLLSIPGVEEVRCAELEPAVLEAKKFFAPFSEGALEDPRLKLVEDDGRSFILGSPVKFDLIVSEPSNPWIAGIGNLYTKEFYEGARRQLNQGGIMAQWFHLYAVTEDDIALVYRTFFSVFPHGGLYRTSAGDILLIGSENPIELKLDRLSQVFGPDSRASFWLASLNLVEPQMLLATYLAERDEVLSWLETRGSEALNTDDLPLLEFRAPLGLYAARTGEQAFSAFHSLLPPSLKDDAAARQASALGRWILRYPIALEDEAEKLRKLEPQSDRLYPTLLEDLASGNDPDFLSLIDSAPSRDRGWLARLGIVWGQRQQLHGQLAGLYEKAWTGSPWSSHLWLLMGHAREMVRRNDLPKARSLYAQAATLTAGDDPLRESVKFAPTGGPEDIAMLRQAIERNPYIADTHHLLAQALHKAGDSQAALAEALESYRLYPLNEELTRLLSELYRERGNAEEVFRYAAEARALRSLERPSSAR